MIKFTKPTNLNGTQLLKELNAAGIKISEPPFIDGEGQLFLDIAEKDFAAVETVVKSHEGKSITAQSTIEEKLAVFGLTVDELKSILLA
jgi:hypothetical protein